MCRKLNKYKKKTIFQKKAARRATKTKLTFVYFQKNTIFQKKGRPQGNIDKTDLRLFTKKAARRVTSTKLTFVYFQKTTIENKNHPVIWREQDGIL